MTSIWEFFVFILVCWFIVPVTIYLSIKLGTYAYFVGRHKFHQEHCLSCERNKTDG